MTWLNCEYVVLNLLCLIEDVVVFIVCSINKRQSRYLKSENWKIWQGPAQTWMASDNAIWLHSAAFETDSLSPGREGGCLTHDLAMNDLAGNSFSVFICHIEYSLQSSQLNVAAAETSSTRKEKPGSLSHFCLEIPEFSSSFHSLPSPR